MSIPVGCLCGKTVWAPPAAANQTILCSRCGTVLRVPVPELETLHEIPVLAGPPLAPRATSFDPAPRATHALRA
jgi:hypothetical protein